MAAPNIGDMIRVVMTVGTARQQKCQRRVFGKVVDVNAKYVKVEGRGEIMAGGEGGNCWLCGQALTNPASVQIGVGPDCARNVGISWLGTVRDRALTAEEIARAKQDMAVTVTLPLMGIAWGPWDGPAPILAMDRPPKPDDRALDRMPPIYPAPTDLVPLDVTLPEPYRFFPYQETGVRMWLTVKDLLLGDEPGAGKTLQVIAGILQARYLERNNPRYKGMKRLPSVIVCPKSLRTNWRAELRKFAPDLKVQVLEGRNDKLAKHMDCYVTHYEALASRQVRGQPTMSKAGAALLKLTMLSLVCDESHKLKSSEAVRTLAVTELAKQADYRILLSGTAILARPRELIPQLDILGKMEQYFGSTSAFRMRFCNLTLRRLGKRRVWDDSGRSNLPELNLRLAPVMLRRLKKDVLKDLPSKSYARVTVDLSNRDEYQRLEEQIEQADSGQRAALTAQLRALMAAGKIEPAIDWIDSFLDATEDEKLIVFAYHRSVQQALVEKFPSAARIFASADMQKLKLDVEEEKRRFQEDPSCRLIVCSMMAAGFGHTLTAASNLLNVEMDWTPGVMSQCEDRLHRPGQEYPCTIWTLVAEDSVDDRLTELLVEKRQVTGVVLDGEEQVLDEQSVSRAAVADILRRVRERKQRAA